MLRSVGLLTCPAAKAWATRGRLMLPVAPYTRAIP
jgi:hypothetical protein